MDSRCHSRVELGRWRGEEWAASSSHESALAPNPFLANDPPPPPPPNPFGPAPSSPPNPFAAPPSPSTTPPPPQQHASYDDIVRGAVAMGFSDADAVRAISAGQTNVDAAINWMLDHPN